MISDFVIYFPCRRGATNDVQVEPSKGPAGAGACEERVVKEGKSLSPSRDILYSIWEGGCSGCQNRVRRRLSIHGCCLSEPPNAIPPLPTSDGMSPPPFPPCRKEHLTLFCRLTCRRCDHDAGSEMRAFQWVVLGEPSTHAGKQVGFRVGGRARCPYYRK
jgi:hypothetical protein